MKKVLRYQCEYCKKEFHTPDRHKCKFNPVLKNCFTCAELKGWKEESDEYTTSPYIDCNRGHDWDLKDIKHWNYDMQCHDWEQKAESEGEDKP